MSLVPLTEGGRVDLNNGALHERVCSDKLVVRSIVHLSRTQTHHNSKSTAQQLQKAAQCSSCTYDRDDTSLPCRVLAGPGEVSRVKTECTVLEVSTAHTNGVDPLGAKLGAGGLTAELEFSLLAVVRTLSTGGRALVPGRAGYTCELYVERPKVEVVERIEYAGRRKKLISNA